jgi:hypothetical protein
MSSAGRVRSRPPTAQRFVGLHCAAHAYAGHTDGRSDPGTTATYIRADIHQIAAALAALTGQPHEPVHRRRDRDRPRRPRRQFGRQVGCRGWPCKRSWAAPATAPTPSNSSRRATRPASPLPCSWWRRRRRSTPRACRSPPRSASSPTGQGGFQLEVTPADDAAAEPAPECRSRAHRGHPLGLPVLQRHARQHADRAAGGEPGWGSVICFC